MSEQMEVSFASAPVHSTRYDPDDDRSPVEAIVGAVGTIEGVDPTELPPLYDSIETDAVNRLFAHDGSESPTSKVLCFTYRDWNIFVRSDGTIIVGDPASKGESTPLSAPVPSA